MKGATAHSTPHNSSSYAVSEIQTELKKREVNATVNHTSRSNCTFAVPSLALMRCLFF